MDVINLHTGKVESITLEEYIEKVVLYVMQLTSTIESLEERISQLENKENMP